MLVGVVVKYESINLLPKYLLVVFENKSVIAIEKTVQALTENHGIR